MDFQEKGKYEVITGGLKSGDDLADYWGDILSKYPSVIALIDPVRRVVSMTIFALDCHCTSTQLLHLN